MHLYVYSAILLVELYTIGTQKESAKGINYSNVIIVKKLETI